eukprot:CAMPEP_0177380346 /NCGR_PEP_ID=MMETSP0368-20130122/47466_1 /TAXON_ID=447022 ORGANISM="Scrippsiella hangoei-like, Strain SHHI-4" /NCGR_SAMPLE_ID=MMETSP0368 /ASSEMBLY_ACC=CAM_ASM_000363 /LENGTH=82 /DNA_ID=CAMNT_0018844651 /DNA_START=435 /DNA_END=680 /DNA_ORIENTATION=-
MPLAAYRVSATADEECQGSWVLTATAPAPAAAAATIRVSAHLLCDLETPMGSEVSLRAASTWTCICRCSVAMSGLKFKFKCN